MFIFPLFPFYMSTENHHVLIVTFCVSLLFLTTISDINCTQLDMAPSSLPHLYLLSVFLLFISLLPCHVLSPASIYTTKYTLLTIPIAPVVSHTIGLQQTLTPPNPHPPPPPSPSPFPPSDNYLTQTQMQSGGLPPPPCALQPPTTPSLRPSIHPIHSHLPPQRMETWMLSLPQLLPLLKGTPASLPRWLFFHWNDGWRWVH